MVTPLGCENKYVAIRYCTAFVSSSSGSTSISQTVIETIASLQVPKKRFRMGMLPTPIHPWHLPRVPEGVDVWIKRDDLTGCQLSGNKVRQPVLIINDALQADSYPDLKD